MSEEEKNTIRQLTRLQRRVLGTLMEKGFTTPDQHRVEWHQLRLVRWDWVALFCLIPFWIARVLVGGMSS